MHRQPDQTQLTDTRLLRRAFGTFATGVTVVTVGGPDPHGMTANSFTTVSLEPPLVLVCIRHDARMHGLLQRIGTFGVSVLASHQEPVARYFADRHRPRGGGEFDAVDWAPGDVSGAPLLVGAVAQLECETWRTYEGGDHTIFLGRLLALEHQPEADVLLFLGGRFHQLGRERSDLTA